MQQPQDRQLEALPQESTSSSRIHDFEVAYHGTSESRVDLEHTATVQRSSGSFSFKVKGFGALPDKVGDSTESPEFELCRRKWQMRIFPNGSLVSHVGYISFYLASKSSILTRASYKLVVVNQVVSFSQ